MPIIRCTCTNKYQDQLYGSGQRVGTPLKPDGAGARSKCTVCGNIVRASGPAKPAEAATEKKPAAKDSKKQNQ